MFASAVHQNIVLIHFLAAVLFRSVVSALINLNLITFKNLQHVTLSFNTQTEQMNRWRQVHKVM